jgi:glycosyltransferase involved in cell wall biosynthesis
MKVSVIVPAHNAARTIAETLASLQGQTWPDWEAIVVDDGSRDETAAIAAGFAEHDARIRAVTSQLHKNDPVSYRIKWLFDCIRSMSPVDESTNWSRRCIKLVSRMAQRIFQQFGFATLGVSQSPSGASAARNTGIRLARFDWLLFLDADDWILPTHLEKMTRALSADRDLDAVYCRYARVAPDGTVVGRTQETKTGDLFAVLARGCIFSIHSCVIRRVLVEAAGGFDTSLRARPARPQSSSCPCRWATAGAVGEPKVPLCELACRPRARSWCRRSTSSRCTRG